MPGLNLFTGNRLVSLADRLAEKISGSPLTSPFEPEIVIVQSQGMERWVSLALAERLGICANVRFPFPNSFIYHLLHQCLPDLPEETKFEPDVLSFTIAKLLPDLLKSDPFSSLNRYISGAQKDLKLYQLAHKIAGVFDQYTIFRPDMTLGWELGTEKDIDRPIDENWQAILWRKIVEDNSFPNRARLINDFLKLLRDDPATWAKLPPRISMFGAPSLPPFYLRIFETLAQLIEVNLFVLNPCREFWDDIASEKGADRAIGRLKQQESDPSALHYESGNSLLASWGIAGRDFLNQVHSLDCNNEVSDFVDPKQDNLLSCVQSDILNLKERGPGAKTTIASTDRSIQVHSCHGPIREIETLHDNLLAMFDADEQLQPKDILVMTPDIEEYAPYIQAVFDTSESETKRIPYSIADRHLGRENPIAAALTALLDLTGSRYELSRIMSLLEMPVVHERFDLKLAEIDLITAWLKDVRVKWGIDSSHRQSLGLPDFSENTWQAGLDRLLLGYALPGGDEKLFRGVLPYDYIEGENAATLGKFARFTDELFSLETELQRPRTLAGWSAALAGLCDQFIAVPDDFESDNRAVRGAIGRLEALQEYSGNETKMSLEVIKNHLQYALEQPGAGRGFIAGGVTFSSMLPMRSLPFKVICLIGLNHDSYPRLDKHLSFDLMAKMPRKGDRSAKNSDRYLFLEAVISAGLILYISYNGQSIEDNSPKPPSTLVSELLDYIERAFEVPGTNIIDYVVTKHRLQAFSPAYFQQSERLFSYSEDNCQAALAASKPRRDPMPLITQGLPAIGDESNKITLDDLCKFFANPAEFFLKNRLGIRFESEETELDELNSFSLTGLDQYLLKQALLQRSLTGADIGSFLPVAKARGILPPGAIGEYAYDSATREVSDFAAELRPLLGQTPLEPLTIDITIGGLQLTGTINSVYREAYYQFRPAQLKAKDYLKFWLTHLALSLGGHPPYPTKSILIGSDHRVELDKVGRAGDILAKLIDVFRQGLLRPIPFFPQTSWTYVKAINENKTDQAMIYAERSWIGGERGRGEGEDQYYQACFGKAAPLGDEFKQLALEVFSPLLDEMKSGIR